MPTTYIPEAIMPDVDLLKQLYAKGQAYNIILYCQEETENEEKKFPHTPSKKEEKEKEENLSLYQKRASENKNQPSLEDIKEYHLMHHFETFDPTLFYAHYQSSGWHDANGNLITDWRAKMIRWEAENKKRQQQYATIRKDRAEQRQQSLLTAESRNQEKADRETAEREQRLAEQKAQAVSYEEYLKMKKTKG